MEKEKVIIVLLNENNKFSQDEVDHKIEELKELVRASNGQVVFTLVQNGNSVNSKYYIGKGKAEEIKNLCDNHDVDSIIFNHELSGSQIKNLEDLIDRKIVDRTGLILDIFATRARTREAKLQVKLAQLEYRLPRLVGFRNYLSREGAGIGTKGPGEQKLETDRRSIQREITSIKHKLKNEKLKRDTKRKRRINSSMPLVSLVGYSNSGKSSILNSLSEYYSDKDKRVYADDMLFASLETSARTISLENGKKILISDTVGFISDLPTKLVESFKSTLEEIEDSNLILLVVDASNPNYEMQIKATIEILSEMDLEDKEILYVFNKMDLNPEFKEVKLDDEAIYISALESEDIKRLQEKISDIVFKSYDTYKVFVNYNKYDRIIDVIPENLKNMEEYKADGIETYIYINKKNKDRYKEIIVEGK